MSLDSANTLALPDGADELTLRLGALLTVLLDASTAPGLSLARISKRAGLPMSSLRRLLTALEDSGLVIVAVSEDGRGKAMLTEQGQALAASLEAPSGTGPS